MPRNRAPSGGLDHPLDGTVEGVLRLTDRVKLRVRVQGDATVTLHMSVPRHLEDRHHLEAGQHIPLRLRGEHIHLMPPEADA